MKKILCNTLIIIFMLGVFCNGYFSFSGLSFSDRYSYAEADNWSSCDTSDLVTAFRYYCKSRNLAIEGSAADALTTFTTSTFNNICSTLGIDPTTLSAELKKTTQGNLGLRFLFSNNGITAYNRIFSEFLQNNDLEVGDEVENKTLYSGKYINGSLVYYVNRPAASNELANVLNRDFSPTDNSYITEYGTSINNTDFITMSPWNQIVQCNFVNYTANCKVYPYNRSVGGEWYYIGYFYPLHYSDNNGFNSDTGFPIRNDGNNPNQPLLKSHACYVHFSDGNLMPCIITFTINNKFCIRQLGFNYKDDNENVKDANVTINNYNGDTINNNEYNNNWTIIYNDGDTYIDNDDPQPPVDTPPSGGGGDDPVNPDPDDPLDPYDPNKTFPDTPDNPTPDPGVHGSPGSDGTITIPDFNFDLPDINWSLDGLQHKFPFSLPFDLYNACKLLNAEPQTPELDYTVDLVVYQWPIQMDLHWLDPAARVIRIFELLAFVVGLILITRHLIGG